MTEPTLSEWMSMDADARGVVLDQLLERMPAGYLDLRTTGLESGPLPQFIHQQTHVLFHVVFGGPAVMGVTSRRQQRVEEFAGIDPRWNERSPLTSLVPPRRVEIETALVADEPLLFGTFKKLGLSDDEAGIRGVTRAAVPRLVDAMDQIGWRAPSESEWEYVCRAVEDEVLDAPLAQPCARLLGSGLAAMGSFSELCCDEWAPDLSGYPETGSRGEAHTVARGGRPYRFDSEFSWAWSEALWPIRRALEEIGGRVAIRPWVSLPK